MTSGIFVTGINTVAMIVAYPIHLHFLGYEQYGIWLLLATVLSFAHFGNLGVTTAVTKFVAEEVGRNNRVGAERYLFNASAILLVVGFLILLLLIVFKTYIAALFGLTDENETVVILLLPRIGILTVYLLFTQVLNAGLAGIGRLDITNYIQSGARIANVIVATILYALGQGIESLIVAYFCSYLVIHISSIFFFRSKAGIRFMKARYIDLACVKRLLSFGGRVVIGQILQLLISPFNKLLLSRYAGVTVIPIYEVGYSSILLIASFLETSFRPLMPEMSRLSATAVTTVTTRITSISKKALYLVSLVGFPTYLFLFALAPALFRLWLRSSFDNNIPYMFRVMLVGSLIYLYGMPANNLLLALGRVNHCLIARCLQALTNVVVAIVGLACLSPSHLPAQVAYAVAGGMISWSFYSISAKRYTLQG